MAEAVRLVIWDLDDTFWKGTVSEGGIRQYVREHHDIVIALAERGIVSSICSKNDPNVVVPILKEYGVFDYFVFPSLSWEPKGLRLAAIIENIQLRPPTVMFIDDNPNNRAEAAAVVPGIQVADETFIPQLLEDPRFTGKNDKELSRLKQYKLLEQRKRDEQQAPQGNEEFLRGCDVRVFIEYNVIPNIDRAIELVNRTNQLNYTKRRLSEDIEKAREELSREVDVFTHQAGLIRVVDKYGDYGFVGFFLTKTMRSDEKRHDSDYANSTLLHFCFSCRTLGMFIEQWVYEHLRRPQLTVVGEVLTDLSVSRDINWIRLVQSLETAAADKPHVAPKIVFWGGCEANAVGVYLAAYADTTQVHGSYAAGPVFVRSNSALVLANLVKRNEGEFHDEASSLNLPVESETAHVFRNDPYGTLYIFNCMLDASDIPIYRHNVNGWMLHLEPPYAPGLHFHIDEEKFRSIMLANLNLSMEQKEHLLDVRRHISLSYHNARPLAEADCINAMRELIERTPVGSKFIIALDHDEHANDQKQVWRALEITRYNSMMRDVAKDYPFVGVASYSEVLQGPEEIRAGGGNHYDRLVYWRFAERIVDVASGLKSRAEASAV